MLPIEHKTLDFIAEVDRVDDADSVRLLFQRFLEAEIGFTNVVCLKVPNASETLNNTIYFNTRPEAWTEHYVEANHIYNDPMVRELFKTYDPYAWSDVLKRRELERSDLRIVQEAGDFGMREGFVVPIYQLNGYFGLVSAAGGKLELSDRMRSVLQLTAIYVHDKVARLHRAMREHKANLTPREVECLKWVSAGKSDWVIGEILNLSERTVNGYIESAKRKYEVTTRVQRFCSPPATVTSISKQRSRVPPTTQNPTVQQRRLMSAIPVITGMRLADPLATGSQNKGERWCRGDDQIVCWR